MIRIRCAVACLLVALTVPLAPASDSPASAVVERWSIVQLVEGDPFRRFYPGALTSLLEEISRQTTIAFEPDPIYISDFEDPRIFESPFIYVNFGDRTDWSFTLAEKENLRRYLDRGGFIFIDAGISAEFLRGEAQHAQSHSFAEWEVTPALAEAFEEIYPDRDFEPLDRSHPVFRSHYFGLPDASSLPEAIRDYVVNEKWPQGTYSFVGLHVEGRLAVLATPIIAMGWGRNELGQWVNPIGFRVREDADGMSARLRDAAYSGRIFTVAREDGLRDTVYCQPENMPAWVEEPDGRFRIFRYYQGTEISDYAHEFYTRLGVNIFIHALSP